MPKNEDEIDELYATGTAEARRILKRGGLLILKTMDTQRWRHAELANLPGFRLLDLLVVVTKGLPPSRPYAQKHARKNHPTSCCSVNLARQFERPALCFTFEPAPRPAGRV